jgi:hypothetical protein
VDLPRQYDDHLFCRQFIAADRFGCKSFFQFGPLVYTLYFMAVAGLMFLEHIRRTKLLGLGWVLTITWVTYRIVLLLLILNLN